MTIEYRNIPSGDYVDEFIKVIRKMEKLIKEVYDDAAPPTANSAGHYASIGDGINLRVRDYLILVLDELGVFAADDARDRIERIINNNFEPETIEERNARYDNIVSGFETIFSNNPLSRPGNVPAGTHSSEITLQNALNNHLVQQYNFSGTGNFELEDQDSKNAVRKILKGFEIGEDLNGDNPGGYYYTDNGKERNLDTRLKSDGFNISVPHDTYEYLALMSLYYNGEGLIGNGIRTALTNGNRAEAWYEIRHNSNNVADDIRNGIAKRRYYESTIFGLYNDPDDVTDAEAEQVLSMYLNRKEGPDKYVSGGPRPGILAYEKKFAEWVEKGNSEQYGYNLSGDERILPLEKLFLPISEYLIKRYAEDELKELGDEFEVDINGEVRIDWYNQWASDTSYTAFQLSSDNNQKQSGDINDLFIGMAGEKNYMASSYGDDVLIGGNQIDRMRSGSGDDLIISKAGNDVLYGGAGNDTFYGGSGNDTFKIIGTDEAYDEFYGGEGEDKIEGSDENDTIRVNQFEGEATVEIIDGGDGDEDKIAGTDQADTIDLSKTTLIGIEKIETGGMNDTIILGDKTPDFYFTIDGGSGDKDTLIFSDKSDVINLGTVREKTDDYGGWIAKRPITGIEVIEGKGGDDIFIWANDLQVTSIDGGEGKNEIVASDVVPTGPYPPPKNNIDLTQIEVKNIQIVRGSIGDDIIKGNNEFNEIYGGGGHDIINGGAGPDRLEGGDGDDNYYADNGDVILDTDHKGRVFFQGEKLDGGIKKEGNDYWEGDGGKYKLSGTTLTFEKDGNTLTILNYNKGKHSLEIHLEEDDKETEQKFSSPLVLDLNNNGTLSVSEYDSPAYFDLDGDGFREKTGWIEAEDGLLALDKDLNGTIDNGNELFGSYTKNKNGNYFDNGFAALSSYDINEDGIINNNDDIYSSLNVWIDANQDGISQTDELYSLESLHINSINLNAQEISETEGLNKITHAATFVQQQTDEQGNVLTDEQGDPLTEEKAVKDVWFYRKAADTIYDFDQEIPPEVLALPDMKGAGRVKNLAHAVACLSKLQYAVYAQNIVHALD